MFFVLYFWGVYEIMIKVVKRVIYVVIGLVDVIDEELMIVFVGVEVLINLRFLIY